MLARERECALRTTDNPRGLVIHDRDDFGTRDVMTYVREARQKLAYSRMKVTVVPLARIATTSELRLTATWLDRIGAEFRDFYEDWLPADVEAGDCVHGTAERFPGVGH